MFYMHEDDSTVVAAMLEFLYSADYSAPRRDDQIDNAEAQRNGELIAPNDKARHPLLFHVDVYTLADRIQNDNLKRTAEEKFKATATTAWNDQEFPAAVESVYANTPPGPKGDRLRRFAAQIAAKHARASFDKDGSFSDMMGGLAEFEKDLVDVLSVEVGDNGMNIRCARASCGSVFWVDVSEPYSAYLSSLRQEIIEARMVALVFKYLSPNCT